jgi:hypothetical protein
LAVNGADFAGGGLPGGVVSFAPGETSKVLTVLVAGDGAKELNESFTVTLSGAPAGVSIGNAAVTGVIFDDDAVGTGTLAIQATSAVKAEGAGGVTPFVFTVLRSGDLSGTAGADWTVAGGGAGGTLAVNALDFVGGVLPSGRVSFGPGQASRTVAVNVAGDRATELNESFTVSLSGVQAGVAVGTGAAVGIIYNDDFVSTPADQVLVGTANADVFLLGGGLDSVTGGAGRDLFLFQPSALGGQPGNTTTLLDFDRGAGEVIDLSAIDGLPGTAGDQAFSFIGAAPFDGSVGQLRWQDAGFGMLLVTGNMNADPAAELAILVKGAGPMDAGWFVL